MITYDPEIQEKLETIKGLDIYMFLNSMIKTSFGFLVMDASHPVHSEMLGSFKFCHKDITRFFYYDRSRHAFGKCSKLLEVYVGMNHPKFRKIVDKYDKVYAMR